MHTDAHYAELKIDRFVRERIAPAVYRETRPVELTAWNVPDEPVPFDVARKAPFEAFAVGDAWGRPWGTVWFRVEATVPADWNAPRTHPELVADLGFTTALPGFQAEGTVYSAAGAIVKAIEPRNRYVRLGSAGSHVDLYIEAAANPDTSGNFKFAPTPLGEKATAGTQLLYRLERMELALFDETVWELQQDIWTLNGLMHELPEASPRRAQILQALVRMTEVVDPDDVAGTAAAGRSALQEVLASPANASAHRLGIVGHAHIDSAWLWPIRETVRKVARTFSNVLDLMDADPEFVFAASSAQQYAWLKECYPELFDRVRTRVAEGRFIPVGGMWVESDTNLPSGESLVRQFLLGKQYFLDEFGIEPEGVWLPDSFGYSAALPQIATAAGCRWFLTQKLSWNQTNRMPHHTFLWEGIDGTRIFTHFPPIDTYTGELSAAELAKAQRQYQDKRRANSSLAPFGWGDGGGGPTREMLAAAKRTRDLEGSPRTTMMTPQRFFETAQAEYPDPPVWSGELYLEFHRGTYTSQARIKRGNRRSERLLREAELWATVAAVRNGAEYPRDLLDQCWKTVLLQQFHDILPGSSIAWVHREAIENYARITGILEGLIAKSLAVLCGSGSATVFANAGPYELAGVAAFGGGTITRPADPAGLDERPDGIVLENSRTRLTIDDQGRFVSLRDLIADRELIPTGHAANLLQVFRDTPTEWDAWNLDEADRNAPQQPVTPVSVAPSPGRTSAVIVRRFGQSTIEQEVSLDAATGAVEMDCRIDWHERQKLLKLAFPLDVQAERAASEIQFGHIYRPTHANTSWDAARFETVAQRWVRVAEPGYGVAIANDATYGHDIRAFAFGRNRVGTMVRLSLLRGSRYPDPTADEGEHQFRIALRPGAGIPEAVEAGYRLNVPLRQVSGAHGIEPFLKMDNRAVVVEAVKPAEDHSGDVIVRLYEAHGTRARAKLALGFGWTSAVETDLLERPIEDDAVNDRMTGQVSLTLRPFQLVTLRFGGVTADRVRPET